MDAAILATSYAPALRSSNDEIKKAAAQFEADSLFVKLINFVPVIVLILDKNRQAIFANQALMDTLLIDNADSFLGKRPGEILNCRHACENEAGCGTTEACRYCGAVNAILQAQKGKRAVEECRILVKGKKTNDALDLRVWATPFAHHQEQFTFYAVVNIADEKQKHFMERIFLHDIMNTATALRGFSDLIKEGAADEESKKEFLQLISFLSGHIVDQINAHRQLIAAEQNELVLAKKTIDSLQFITGLFNSYNRQEMLDNRKIKLDEAAQSIQFTSDETLLGRVVGNMIKNAIEASMPGETVTIGCFVADDKIHFQVSNPTYMPEKVRLQIFNRSFSTKGAGRGLGTYSMKYLTDKYLQGQISFISNEDKGTTFTAVYPLVLQ